MSVTPEFLAEQITKLTPSCGNTVVVGIDGGGGAGKSTLARRLAELIPEAQILHTDDFASWDIPLEWWPRLLAQVLEPLAQGVPANYQRFDWDRRELAEWHVLKPAILLLEGVSATRREFRPYLALAIYVTCPPEERLRRGLERDGAGAHSQWQAWMQAEDGYIAEHQPLENADYVVDGVNS